MSHKAWMKTVPTENCDVLMTFPGRETPGVRGAGAGSAGAEQRGGSAELQWGWGTGGGTTGTGAGCAGRRGQPGPRRGADRCRPDTTDDHTLLWLLNHIRLGIPELIVQVRHHKHTRVYAFFVTATYER